MKFPNFGGSINLGQVVLTAANTNTDGVTGAYSVLLTGAGKFAQVTFSANTDTKIQVT